MLIVYLALQIKCHLISVQSALAETENVKKTYVNSAPACSRLLVMWKEDSFCVLCKCNE